MITQFIYLIDIDPGFGKTLSVNAYISVNYHAQPRWLVLKDAFFVIVDLAWTGQQKRKTRRTSYHGL